MGGQPPRQAEVGVAGPGPGQPMGPLLTLESHLGLVRPGGVPAQKWPPSVTQVPETPPLAQRALGLPTALALQTLPS